MVWVTDYDFLQLNNLATMFNNLSLRTRLVIGIVVLSAVGFAVSDYFAQTQLRSFLFKQVDDQLTSVAGGSVPRIQRAGIVIAERDEALGDDKGENHARGRQRSVAAPTPLQRIPTNTSITVLDENGAIVGAIGGDLNSIAIADYVTGWSPEKAASYGEAPFTLETQGSDFRVLARALPGQAGTVVVAQSLEDLDQTLHNLNRIFLLIGLIALIIIALVGRFVIRIGLKPLNDVEDIAEQIAEGDLSARLPDSKPTTEVGRLVTSLNRMLTRIEDAFAARTASEEKLRRFVADASHELRTPLTAIRGFAELHRQGAVTGEDKTKELIGRIENESVRMGSLVEDLLLLARLDQAREMDKAPVDLVALVRESVASAQAAGPDHPITTDIAVDELFVLGDKVRIYQVISNLLANARTHTPAGTAITVRAWSDEKGGYISVGDNGPGLSDEDQKKIFERFYRADVSRVRNGGEGTGLGLSIVDAVMRGHGGSVSVHSELGKGSTFTLFFDNGVN